jgi:hypothetical protein
MMGNQGYIHEASPHGGPIIIVLLLLELLAEGQAAQICHSGVGW